MAKRDLPPLYVDEHIKQGVIDAFKENGFKCIEISKTNKQAGRDEIDYIQEIYAEGKVFVTSDNGFFKVVKVNKLKHAGIVYIPSDLDSERAEVYSAILALLIKLTIDVAGKHGMRKTILYINQDGHRMIDEKGGDTLLYPMTGYPFLQLEPE